MLCLTAMRRAICFAAAAVIVGCSPRHETSAQDSAHLKPAPSRVAAAIPCSPDELSCGLQKPVVSDGKRRFINAEMSLGAVFPRGSRVCMTRSGDAARGFYAWYGVETVGCPERGDIQATRMTINSYWNATFYTSLRQVMEHMPNCTRTSGSLKRILRGSSLAIGTVPSRACARDGQNGAFEIDVYALAGRPLSDTLSRAESTIYVASLETSAERANRDLAMFQTFLRQLRVGNR
jgi:hypothetical protein